MRLQEGARLAVAAARRQGMQGRAAAAAMAPGLGTRPVADSPPPGGAPFPQAPFPQAGVERPAAGPKAAAVAAERGRRTAAVMAFAADA